MALRWGVWWELSKDTFSQSFQETFSGSFLETSSKSFIPNFVFWTLQLGENRVLADLKKKEISFKIRVFTIRIKLSNPPKTFCDHQCSDNVQ